MIDSDADVGGMIGDPTEFERRFSRARRAAPGMYQTGEAGRERFREEDRMHLDSGLDLVRTLERVGELQAAGTRRAQLTRRLEQTLAGVSRLRASRRLGSCGRRCHRYRGDPRAVPSGGRRKSGLPGGSGACRRPRRP